MGLIQRQGLKFSIVNWFGIFIGALSTVYVFPYALEEYGMMRFILDTAALLFPLVSLGSSTVIMRFFPYFEDKPTQHHGFLGLMLLWTFLGCFLFILLAFIFKDAVIERYGEKNPLFEQYLWLTIPTLVLTALNTVFYRFAINFKRIVIPSILLDVSQKFVLPLLVIFYLKRWISLDWVMYGLVIYLVFAAIGFVFYIIHLKAWRLKPDFSFIAPTMWKEMRSYAIYGIISGFALLIISKLDSLLVGSLLDLRRGGIYSISAFIANVIEVPSRALVGIGAPLIAKYWMDNNMKEMHDLYQKVSINLIILGLLLFGAFWISVDAFFQIIANGSEMQQGKYVILILGMARLVDMATGLNNHLLIYSSKFKYSYFQIIIPAIVSLCLGYWFTLSYGIIGSAIANLIAITLYNLISIGINWYFFKLQPFSKNSIKILLISVGVYGIISLLPVPASPYLSILVRSSLFVGAFLSIVLWLRLSSDLNFMVNKFTRFKK